jgi:hypothetical protein
MASDKIGNPYPRTIVVVLTEEGKLCRIFSNQKKVWSYLEKSSLVSQVFHHGKERINSYSGFCKRMGPHGMTVERFKGAGKTERYLIQKMPIE